jgi:hypothetical protein
LQFELTTVAGGGALVVVVEDVVEVVLVVEDVVEVVLVGVDVDDVVWVCEDVEVVPLCFDVVLLEAPPHPEAVAAAITPSAPAMRARAARERRRRPEVGGCGGETVTRPSLTSDSLSVIGPPAGFAATIRGVERMCLCAVRSTPHGVRRAADTPAVRRQEQPSGR